MSCSQDLPELLPVLVLVHDAWHKPTHYCAFIDHLSALGYPITCPELPTAGSEGTNKDKDNSSTEHDASFHDDVSLIYQLVFDLCSDGNDVMVLAHGYGAFVATEAIGELGKKTRENFSNVGGVVGFVAIAGVLPEQGRNFKDSLSGHLGAEWPPYISQQVWSLDLPSSARM